MPSGPTPADYWLRLLRCCPDEAWPVGRGRSAWRDFPLLIWLGTAALLALVHRWLPATELATAASGSAWGRDPFDSGVGLPLLPNAASSASEIRPQSQPTTGA